MSKKNLRASAAIPAQAANARGEATLDLGVRKLKLKVTLGAMAKAEDEFGCAFTEIETKLADTKSIAKFFAILARAAGEEVSEDEIRYADIEMRDLMAAVQAAAGNDQGNAVAPSL